MGERSTTVLLIEDELLLCWTLEEALHDAGYNLLYATTGNGGLAMIEGCEKYDALVTNIRLVDGPDGWSLAQRARELHPDIAVVFVSGDSGVDHATHGVGGSIMLSKPFRPSDVQSALEELLIRRD